MKKLLLATIVASFAVLTTQSWYRSRGYEGNGGCCGRTAVVETAEVCEPTPPKCYKTVEVAAKKIVCPQPDICERIPQPAKCIRIPQPPIPQPDIIKYECQPDKIVYHKQPPLIRYECPAECD